MKKISILTLAILMTIISCQKEQISDSTPTKNGDYFTYKLNTSDDLSNTEDSEAEKIDKQLLVLSDVFVETLKSNEIREYIYNSAKTNDGFLSLENFFTKFPSIKNDIDQKISSNQYAKEFNIRNLADINNNMMHMGTQMYPVINIPNIENFQNSNNFISSAGIEIEDDETNNIMDEIFAWFIKDGKKIEISIGEKIALEKSIPLFVFTVHNNPEEYSDNNSSTANNNEVAIYENFSEKTNWGTRNNYHRINYRFEGSGSSEYTITGKSYGRCNISSSIYSCQFNFYTTAGSYKYKQIASVKKSKINQNIYKTNYDLVESSTSKRFYFNTFERDWYSSPKHLGSVTKNSNTITLRGRMTYPNEYYWASPSGMKYNRYTHPKYYGNYRGGINIRN